MFNKLKSLVLAAALSVAAVSSAFAQFAPTPSASTFRNTYRASISALATATNATDFFTINGSATKNVAITQFDCTGIGTTAATPVIQLIKRSTANTGGTSTTQTAVPLATSTALANGTATPAATAVVRAYTVNPSALGTAVGTLDSNRMATPLAATGANLQSLRFVFSDARYSQPLMLLGAAQTASLNGAAALATGTALDCSVEWYEF